MSDPRGSDPLNEILLPALALAERIQSRKTDGKAGRAKLAGALMILVAERQTYRLLLQLAEDQAQEESVYTRELEAELSAESLRQVRERLRLHSRPTSVSS